MIRLLFYFYFLDFCTVYFVINFILITLIVFLQIYRYNNNVNISGCFKDRELYILFVKDVLVHQRLFSVGYDSVSHVCVMLKVDAAFGMIWSSAAVMVLGL